MHAGRRPKERLGVTAISMISAKHLLLSLDVILINDLIDLSLER
jgi:hypothetical protein